MDSGPRTYSIEGSVGPPKKLTVASGVTFLLLGWVNLALWLIAGGTLTLVIAVMSGLAGVATCASMWSLASRTPHAPPLAADAEALRLSMPAPAPLVLPWESLREVRVGRAPLGQRVTAVPADMDDALARLPERVPRVTRQRWRRSGRISVGIGRRSTDTDAIVAALAELAAGRCAVVRG
jgi:hypothetical protein